MTSQASSTMKIAAISDIHYKKNSQGMLQHVFAQVDDHADVLLLCGDLTDYGLPEEARHLAADLRGVKATMLGVLGNHDIESDQQEEVVKILSDAGVMFLDGDSTEIRGVGFAGTKGFGGGFGRRALGPWGEKVIKDFVQEAIDESMKLEMALSRLRTEQKVVLLHYSPIQATVNGEPPEIIPFLGSSRLEEPIIRYRANAVFHGHAHHGSVEGRTRNDIPVYNVCIGLLQQEFPGRVPLRVIEVPVAPAVQNNHDAIVASL